MQTDNLYGDRMIFLRLILYIYRKAVASVRRPQAAGRVLGQRVQRAAVRDTGRQSLKAAVLALMHLYGLSADGLLALLVSATCFARSARAVLVC